MRIKVTRDGDLNLLPNESNKYNQITPLDDYHKPINWREATPQDIEVTDKFVNDMKQQPSAESIDSKDGIFDRILESTKDTILTSIRDIGDQAIDTVVNTATDIAQNAIRDYVTDPLNQIQQDLTEVAQNAVSTAQDYLKTTLRPWETRDLDKGYQAIEEETNFVAELRSNPMGLNFDYKRTINGVDVETETVAKLITGNPLELIRSNEAVEKGVEEDVKRYKKDNSIKYDGETFDNPDINKLTANSKLKDLPTSKPKNSINSCLKLTPELANKFKQSYPSILGNKEPNFKEEDLPFISKVNDNGNVSLSNLFRLTFWDTFRWAIKLSNKSEDGSPTLGGVKTYAPPNPFEKELNGFLPVVGFDFSERSTKLHDYTLPNGTVIKVPGGYTADYEIVTQLKESDEFKWDNYKRTYYRIMVNGEKVMPYKNCVSRLTVYLYRSIGTVMFKQDFLVIPNIQLTKNGTSNSGTEDFSINWSIVAEGKLMVGTSINNEQGTHVI